MRAVWEIPHGPARMAGGYASAASAVGRHMKGSGLQPVLTETFTGSAAWGSMSASARGVLEGMLELAFRRANGWAVDSSAKEMSQWFGAELGLPPAEILGGLRELEEGGYLTKSSMGTGMRYVVKAPLEEP